MQIQYNISSLHQSKLSLFLAFEASIDDLKTESVEVCLNDEYLELEQEWTNLNDAIAKRGDKLAKSFQIHKFLDECNEAVSFINNRTEILENSEIPLTVAQSEQELRNHERSFQEIKAFQNRIDHLTAQLTNFDAPVCTEENKKVQQKWKDLTDAYEEREKRIKEELRLQRFDDSASTYLKWGKEIVAEMDDLEEPENDHQANTSYEMHMQRKGEIDSNMTKSDGLIREGIIVEEAATVEDIKICNEDINRIWVEKEEYFKSAKEFYRFMKEADEEIAWINDTKQLLNNAQSHLKSIEEAENAQLEHNAITAAIVAKQPTIKDLIAREVVFNSDETDSKKDELKLLVAALEDGEKEQEENIAKALKLHQFMHDASELDELIDSKLKDSEESDPRDLINLPKKGQQNMNLKNEIAANQNRITALHEDAQELSDEPEVQEKLENIEEKWDKLQTAVHEKSNILDEAEKAASFIRSCEEANQWMDNNEPKVKSQELAKDCQATQILLNQHNAVKDDFKTQRAKISELETKAEELDQANNFKSEELKTRSSDIRERYDALVPVVKARGEVLKNSLTDYELLQDINEERTICAEQQTLLGSDFKPKDIVSAEAALTKTANLKSEVVSASNQVDNLGNEAEKRYFILYCILLQTLNSSGFPTEAGIKTTGKFKIPQFLLPSVCY